MSIEDGDSWLGRIRTRLTWEHTTFACSAEVIDSTKRLYSSEAPRDSFSSRRCNTPRLALAETEPFFFLGKSRIRHRIIDPVINFSWVNPGVRLTWR